MAISTAAAASTLALSSTRGRRTRPITSSSSSSSASSLAASSSLFFNDTKRAGLGLAFKVQTAIKYNNNVKKRGLSCNCLFGLGVPELVVIAGVAALVFGPKQLPEVGRSFGKTLKSFQQAAKEFEAELKKEPDAVAESSAEKAVAVPDEEKQKSTAVTEEKQDVTAASAKES